jgi:hypothetical protein
MSCSFETELAILADGSFLAARQKLDFFCSPACHFNGHPFMFFPALYPYPLRQAWGSLDALVGRFRTAFEENGS